MSLRRHVAFWTIVLTSIAGLRGAACLGTAPADHQGGPGSAARDGPVDADPRRKTWPPWKAIACCRTSAGEDLGRFYADDYLLIRAMPRHVGHTMPSVQEAFAPYYCRRIRGVAAPRLRRTPAGRSGRCCTSSRT